MLRADFGPLGVATPSETGPLEPTGAAEIDAPVGPRPEGRGASEAS